MSKLTVGVLRGGPGAWYDASLKSGSIVLKNMPEKYRTKDIFISRDGEWHHDGMPRPPHEILRHVDVIFNALHGDFGESGRVQKTIEMFGTPYTGSNSFSSALSFNKHLSKPMFEDAGLDVPTSYIVKNDEDLDVVTHYLFENVPLPLVVKPVSTGALQGITLVLAHKDIPDALQNAFQYSDKALIEEYIRGKEASVGILENFRGQQTYALVPIEILNGERHYPASFSESEREALEATARKAHHALSLRHYSKIDLIITPKGDVYVLEANTLPRLEQDQTLPQSLEAVGCTMPDFLDHMIGLALNK